MKNYSLALDGDQIEKEYWDKFIRIEFPSYERFWQKEIIVLTNRPKDIHFKTDPQLKKLGKSREDITLAQLHYTVLKHLARAYDLRQIYPLNLDQFLEGLVRICAALDAADELLQRFLNKGQYAPLSEKDGQRARFDWRKKQNSLQYLRDYRNKLLHGRILPSILIIGSYIRYRIPKFKKEDKYLDLAKSYPSIGWFRGKGSIRF